MVSEKKEIVVVVLGVILNDQGQVLLSLRRDEDVPLADRKWELPGGKIEFGETAVTCVKREVEEETGYLVDPYALVDCLWSNIWETSEHQFLQAILIPFLCRVTGGEEVMSDREVRELKWFSLQEIKSLNCLPGAREIVETAFAKQNHLQKEPHYARRKAII